MNIIVKHTIPSDAPSISPDLSAVIDVMQSGCALTARELTPSRVLEAREIVASGARMTEAAGPLIVSAWLKKLAPLVRNAPSSSAEASGYARMATEICGDLPAGAFTEEGRKAWVRQGEKGTWWPSIAELYAHLNRFGEPLRRQVIGARRIVEMAQRKPGAPSRQKPTDEEKAAVRAGLDELHAERRAREEDERKIREHGAWMPDDCTGLTGVALSEGLRRHLPELSGDRLEVTRRRIEAIEAATTMAAALLGSVPSVGQPGSVCDVMHTCCEDA
ncbi:hypothetical protein [Acetobacter oeni]|uniref:Uncharacterized protein n=1 Tax=Acetobacter oeni TaxID=304077 RepID=A0A511XJQ1_9PROT|nr:hypothetical protein [Acetobacter oeni]MBB3883384.1 hypothetical protein [Acetobacter oeni]NHO19363.1 hypothetical protein [Acetobacter oeni]GBR03917.1 hypothetical protein AA21952_1223 [Acetobacter oeni LMG 21952]GEN63166.1 hypothetical protein AOE01nite_13900 [Acetobacter oeni]